MIPNADDLVLTPRGLRFMGRHFPVSIGRGGLTDAKREGDGATPRGIWHITDLLYRADRMARPAPWAKPIGPGDLWCDAPDHPAYNQAVKAPFDASHETLRRADPLYDLVLITNWNAPQPCDSGECRTTPYLGSAIFIHRWRKPHHPTAGCLAFDPRDLLFIAQSAPPGSRVVVR